MLPKKDISIQTLLDGENLCGPDYCSSVTIAIYILIFIL